jgi:hypothetical protein
MTDLNRDWHDKRRYLRDPAPTRASLMVIAGLAIVVAVLLIFGGLHA